MHTPGPWKWWTSNSWRRLKADHGRDTPDVLMPCVHKDGQPDITATADDMGLIAAAPQMLKALEAVDGLAAINALAPAVHGFEIETRAKVRAAVDALVKEAITAAKTPVQP
jgi:hypothetical protein